MKKSILRLFCFIAMLLPAVTAFTQKVKEGKVTYGITYPDSQLDQQVQSKFPVEAVLYFKNGKNRTEINMPSGNSIYIEEVQKGSGTMLTELKGNKFSVEVSREKIVGQRFQQPKVNLSEETKTIAGYKCKKANVAVRNKEEDEWREFDVWYTPDIGASNGFFNLIEGLNGFMLEYEAIQNGIKMKLVAKKVESVPVDDAKFVIPAGYKLISEDDLNNMRNDVK